MNLFKLWVNKPVWWSLTTPSLPSWLQEELARPQPRPFICLCTLPGPANKGQPVIYTWINLLVPCLCKKRQSGCCSSLQKLQEQLMVKGYSMWVAATKEQCVLSQASLCCSQQVMSHGLRWRYTPDRSWYKILVGICDELNPHFDKAQGFRFFMSQICLHGAAVSNYHQHLLIQYAMNLTLDENNPKILQFCFYFLFFRIYKLLTLCSRKSKKGLFSFLVADKRQHLEEGFLLSGAFSYCTAALASLGPSITLPSSFVPLVLTFAQELEASLSSLSVLWPARCNYRKKQILKYNHLKQHTPCQKKKKKKAKRERERGVRGVWFTMSLPSKNLKLKYKTKTEMFSFSTP